MKRGVGVYIFNDDGTKVLMAQRGPKARHEQFKWEGPGGQLDEGETYEAAAKREILEELGIQIDLGPVIGEYDHVVDANGEAWEAKIFSATTKQTPHLPEPDKVCGFGWFTREEVARLSLADYAVNDLQKTGWLAA